MIVVVYTSSRNEARLSPNASQGDEDEAVLRARVVDLEHKLAAQTVAVAAVARGDPDASDVAARAGSAEEEDEGGPGPPGGG